MAFTRSIRRCDSFIDDSGVAFTVGIDFEVVGIVRRLFSAIWLPVGPARDGANKYEPVGDITDGAGSGQKKRIRKRKVKPADVKMGHILAVFIWDQF